MLRLNHSLIPAAKTCSLLLAATVATSLCAQAGTDDTSKDVNKNVIEKPVTVPRFYVEIGATGEFDYHATKFISDGGADFGSPTAGGRATLAPLGVSLPGIIQSRDFTSTHDVAAVDGRVNFGYIINPLLTVYGGFVYSHDDGDRSRRLGRVTDPSGYFGPAGANYDLYGDVGQYQSYAGIAGIKFTLPRTILDAIHAPKFITPYFNASVGGKYLDSQHVRFYSGQVDAVNTNVKLYDPSLVLTSQAGFGYELKISRNFSVNVDTDYGYDSKPQNPGAAPGIAGFSGVDKGGDRLYSTVGLSAMFKF